MPDLVYEPRPAEGYALFTLNRPLRLNAIGGDMMSELEDAIRSFTADPAMRAGILTGAGRAFSAGADMREGAERDAALTALQGRRDRGEIAAGQFETEAALTRQSGTPVRFDLFSENPKPFISAINGAAIGGGMHWAMDCDIRIASTEAYLGLYEPRRGIAAGYGSQYLGTLIPFGEAMYILLTCDRVSAEEAQRIGLVHQVLEPDRLLERAAEIADMIAGGAPMAIRATKALAQFRRKHELEALRRYAQPITQEVMNSEDVKEGRRAFVDKRAPQWKGR